MSRNGKRGFKRLESHEMATFGGIQGESDSEVELDLRGGDGDREPASRSCCCWFYALLFVVLATLLLLLGVFTVYLTYNVWQLSDLVTKQQEQIDSLASKDQFIKYKEESSHLLQGIMATVGQLNQTIREVRRAHQKSVAEMELGVEQKLGEGLASMESLEARVDSIDERLSLIEKNPQETLIQHVNDIHREMVLLNESMGLLQQSLEDVQAIKTSMAAMGSEIDSYDSQLSQLKRDFGDVRHEHTQTQDSVDAINGDVTAMKTKFGELQTSVSSSHDQMQQSLDLLTSQFTNIQVVVSELNETMLEDFEEVWANITLVSTKLSRLDSYVQALPELHTLTHPNVTAEPETPSSATSEPVPSPSSPSSSPSSVSSTEATVPSTAATEASEQSTEGDTISVVTPTVDDTPTTSSSSTSDPTSQESTENPMTPSTATSKPVSDESTGATEESPGKDHGEETSSPETPPTDSANSPPTDSSNAPPTDSSNPPPTDSSNAPPTDSTGATEHRTDIFTDGGDNEAGDGTSVATETIPQGNESLTTGDTGSHGNESMGNSSTDTIDHEKVAAALRMLLLNFYSLYDMNGDGSLSETEFLAVIDSEQAFEALDFDKNQSITYKEIEDYLNFYMQKHNLTPPPPTQPLAPTPS